MVLLLVPELLYSIEDPVHKMVVDYGETTS